MSWTMSGEHITDLARGAAVFGTGGGGDPYVGALLARAAIDEHGPVQVVSLEEVPENALVVTVAMMGAPTVMVEKLPGLEEIMDVIERVSRLFGTPVTHIACAEIGGVNSTIPVAAAAACQLPLLDADGMGRAFPELQMVLPTLYGVSASPLAFSDEKGNGGVLETIDNAWTERIGRVACVEMGCSIMIAGFQMSGTTARRAMVPGSLTRSLDVGRAIVESREAKVDPVARAVEILGGCEVFAGTVIDVHRTTTAGFARGQARVEASPGEELLLSFQNEILIAQRGDQVLATTPDLLMVLEEDSGEPVTTEGLRYGQRVRVIAAPADERWHSPEAIAMVGPRYFGYDLEPHRFDGHVKMGEKIR
ncbi:DUF917 domain-containing protein [Micrococcus luteus]|uniref:DUF917 domain-containing protein n=1 Tax=Micrococcus luteus TaxID=1270 RepID=UPI0033DE68E8